MTKVGTLRLQSPLTIANSLTLTRGSILTDATNLLTIPNGVVVSGGNDSSYVSGPMDKIGNSAFTFPLGAVNKLCTFNYYGACEYDG